ncbi:MAG: hypothetical protein H6670_09665 [Anaerolineaceae bacterium]|nr:hypothetical protein [Anaerolineaceae bacterium]
MMWRLLVALFVSAIFASGLFAQTAEPTEAEIDITPTAIEIGIQVQFSGDVVAQLLVTDSSILIGEPFTLTLTISVAPGITIPDWPILPNEDLVFEVLEAPDPVETEVEGRVEYRQDMIATIWRSGTYLTPEVAVVYESSNGDAGAVPLQSASIFVDSVLVSAVDLSLRPAAPPIDLPYIPPTVYIIAIIIVATVLWIVLRILGGGLRQIRFVTRTTPLQRAVAGLSDIEKQNLPPVAALPLAADIIRRYLAERFDIPATEQTTAELLQSVGEWMPSQRQRQLSQLLNQADLAKFAQHQPDSDLSEKVISFGIKWLRAIDGLSAAMEVTGHE